MISQSIHSLYFCIVLDCCLIFVIGRVKCSVSLLKAMRRNGVGVTLKLKLGVLVLLSQSIEGLRLTISYCFGMTIILFF